MTSALVARTPVAACLFVSQGYARKKLDGTKLNSNLKNFLSGAFAGFVYTNFAFIFDLLKIRA